MHGLSQDRPAIGQHTRLDEAVRHMAGLRGDEPALTFVHRRGGEKIALTYADLDRRARVVAGELQRRFDPDDRVAVVCPHDASYAIAFTACLYAGVPAVPLYVPEPFRKPDRLLASLVDSASAGLVTTASARPSVERVLAESGHPPRAVVEVDTVPDSVASEWSAVRPPGGATAYLQYTSGSTGAPAGVRITHDNLAAATHQLRVHFPQAQTVASWVPFFHDMGLVYGLVAPLCAGSHSVQSSPMGFVHDPFQWLEAITTYRAEWTVTPNFGLDHCLRRAEPERVRALDLRCLRALSVAGEPVHAPTVDEFTRVFAQAGLDPGAIAPCYGLAEATLAVTATPLGEGVRSRLFDRGELSEGRAVPVPDHDSDGGVRLVACGTPKEGAAVVIADPQTSREVPPGAVAEVWTRGPNVAAGYWDSPERGARRFSDVVYRADDTPLPGPWLRTGDLGFLLDGRLFVVGRTDDVIIVRGRNHYPDDIESDVRAATPCTAVAFSTTEDGQQRLVVLVEPFHPGAHATAEERAAVVETVRKVVVRGHGIEPHEVIPVRRGVIPRTTSGKIQRSRCRRIHENGEFG